jgi:hypothetical protein
MINSNEIMTGIYGMNFQEKTIGGKKSIFLENLWGVLDGGNWMIFFWSSDQMFSLKADKICTGII